VKRILVNSKSFLTALAGSTIILLLVGGAILQGAILGENSKTNEGDVFVLEPFFVMPTGQEELLKHIVMSDIKIKPLLEETEYEVEIQVGARLMNGLGPDKIMEWLKSEPRDTSIIKEYAGLLYIGHNDMYTFTINLKAVTT
jgi:hypothetical protein